jgi:hypothetical protein
MRPGQHSSDLKYGMASRAIVDSVEVTPVTGIFDCLGWRGVGLHLLCLCNEYTVPVGRWRGLCEPPNAISV